MIDSPNRLLEQSFQITTSKEALELAHTAYQYCQSHPQIIKEISKNIYSFATSQNDKGLKAAIFPFYGEQFITERKCISQYETIIQEGLELVEFAEFDFDRAQIISTCAVLYFINNQPQKAVELQLKANDFNKNHEYKVYLGFNNLAEMYFENEQYEECWNVLFSIEKELLEHLQHPEKVLASQYNYFIYSYVHLQYIFSGLYQRFGEIEFSEMHINRGLERCTDELIIFKHYLLLSRAENLVRMERTDEAYQLYEIIYNEAHEINSSTIILITYIQRSYLLLKQGNIKLAKEFAEFAYHQGKQYQDNVVVLECTLLWAECLVTEIHLNAKTNEAISYNIEMIQSIIDKIHKLIAESGKETHKQDFRKILATWYKIIGKYELSFSIMQETILSEKSSIINNLRGKLYHAKFLSEHNEYRQNITSLTQTGTTHYSSIKDKNSSSFSPKEYLKSISEVAQKVSTQIENLRSNDYLQEIELLQHLLHKHLGTHDATEEIQQKIVQIHHNFLKKLVLICPQLTSTELRVCVLLRMNLSTHQISLILSISPLTVYTHRKNIRKKLQIHESKDLSVFLLQINE